MGYLNRLSEDDQEWLKSNYPKLLVAEEGISGIVEFTATYNKEHDRFLIITSSTDDIVGGLRLSGSFDISINDRVDKRFSNLPALYIKGEAWGTDRHINTYDKSACLCSPMQEDDFLQPEFQFRQYVEQLVIPFLYGQVYYSKNKNWPWIDLAHGSIGLFESYYRIADSSKVIECLEKLKYDTIWPEIKKLLKQKKEIKGHVTCLCFEKGQFRNCHPEAWKGLRRLQEDVKRLELKIL